LPEGVIVGGWSYVVAGYTITALVLAGYALGLKARRRRTPPGGEA
jgi:hypothetical protein